MKNLDRKKVLIEEIIIQHHNVQKEREKIKKREIKFKFTAPKRDLSIYGGWVNAYEPVNKGKLGSSQEWRIEKPIKSYY